MYQGYVQVFIHF